MSKSTEEKIIGKTYSLYGNENFSDSFYKNLSDFTNSIINEYNNEESLLELIRRSSRSRRALRKETQPSRKNSYLNRILNEAENTFSKYFTDLDYHLKNLSLSEKCDSTLTTSREQYFLYMIEIELANRLNKEKFNLSETKFAFLPHCLHDLDKKCISASDGTDYVCKSCSKNCSINNVSKIMKLHNIKAYIWQEADLKKVFRLAKSKGQSAGAIGVACVPELVISKWN